ncbi:MAG: aminotransferase class V-fold PLP-dependent enzyme [Gemmatimonadetes bacterium]|nr:aminotransferase class V-fold PLP-dependent enzyme [Gemmatimonadota bacterium]
MSGSFPLPPHPLIDTIGSSVVGADAAVQTPFGLRRVTYADYTASGRSLGFVEDFLREHVLPLYANTHTETSGTGRQTSRFREEAREIIRAAVGATRTEHAVIFVGSGSTGAVDRLVNILGLRLPVELAEQLGLQARIPPHRRPVVFVGPYEHHSNELPWRESIADVVEIGEDANGAIDLLELERRLEEYQDRPLRIGSFSAASNVTGVISDTSAISSLLHRHGALSFWDFAASAPYVQVEMRSPTAHGTDFKDAVFLSPHKFIGGPGTPGILVLRRDILRNRVPGVPGGGTVQYVNPEGHRYLEDPEHREEGGTPAIIESIRAGLVFQLKEVVGIEEIRRREEAFIRGAIAAWSANPRLQILGHPDAERLSIVSFVVHAPPVLANGSARYLHHNFVVALLNDLFGIQARGGCSCAGPYGHRLLGIDLETSHRFESVITQGCEVIKPGWVRVSFNYFIAEAEFRFLLDAVDLVAREGWRLLPQYHFAVETGVWRHATITPEPPMTLAAIRYEDGQLRFDGRHYREPISRLAAYLEEARRVLGAASRAPGPPDRGGGQAPLPEAAEQLRWFVLPTAAAAV